MEFKFAKISDLDTLMCIQYNAEQHIKNKEMLVTLSVDEIVENINNQLLCVCVIDGNIVAFRSMHIPKEDYLGKYISLKESDKDKLIYSDITVVHPDYRGLGLQRKMGEWLFGRIDPKYTIIMATVHPDNLASIKDKFYHDMRIIAKDKVYGDKVRYVFVKYRNTSWNYSEEVRVAIDDEDSIEKLLNNYYVGIGIKDNLLIFTK